MGALFTAFNIGRDMELHIEVKNLAGFAVPNPSPGTAAATVPLFDIGDLGLLQNFNCDPVFGNIEVRAINLGGATASRDDFQKWEGRFEVVRQTAASDYLMQVLQDAFLAGSGQITATITQTIYDSRGPATGTVQLVWAEAVLKPEKAGDYSTDNPVVQAFAFSAPKRTMTTVTATSGGSITENSLSVLAETLKIVQ